MSWMDTWSRPSANSKIPAPLYLSYADIPYCHTCGRVMQNKKATSKQHNIVKYCSDRCRSRKPGPIDRRIERTIVALLNSEPDSGLEKTAAKTRIVKGDQRIIVTCDEIEELVFGSRFDPEKVYGRRKNRKTRAIGDTNAEWKSVDMQSEDAASSDGSDDLRPSLDEDMNLTDGSVDSVHGGVRVRPPQHRSEVNFSVGGERSRAEKIDETPADLEKRRQGAKRAEEREMVRRAMRRGIVFGFEVQKQLDNGSKPAKSKSKGNNVDHIEANDQTDTELRKAEAIMNGIVVEPSFAKGNWSTRWRQ